MKKLLLLMLFMSGFGVSVNAMMETVSDEEADSEMRQQAENRFEINRFYLGMFADIEKLFDGNLNLLKLDEAIVETEKDLNRFETKIKQHMRYLSPNDSAYYLLRQIYGQVLLAGDLLSILASIKSEKIQKKYYNETLRELRMLSDLPRGIFKNRNPLNASSRPSITEVISSLNRVSDIVKQYTQLFEDKIVPHFNNEYAINMIYRGRQKHRYAYSLTYKIIEEINRFINLHTALLDKAEKYAKKSDLKAAGLVSFKKFKKLDVKVHLKKDKIKVEFIGLSQFKK